VAVVATLQDVHLYTPDICTIYALMHKVAAGKIRRGQKKKNLIYICPDVARILHHRSHGCTSPYYLISNAAS
jgi:hypothetical protein